MNKQKHAFTNFVKGRGFASGVLTAVIIISVVFVNTIIYTITNALALQIPLKKETLDLSISSANDELFEKYIEQGREVEVIFCSYEDDVKNNEKGAVVYQTAKNFEEKYPDFIKLKFVNSLTQLDADGNPVDLFKFVENDENYINSNSVIFSTDTNYRVLTDTYTSTGYSDFYTLDSNLNTLSYNGEEVFASSVIWAMQPVDNERVAYFTTGHGETSNAIFYNLLSSAGYTVKELNLRKSAVPDDADLVIISNPLFDFERSAEGATVVSEYDRLKNYRDKGGNFLVIIDPLVNKAFNVLSSFIDDYGFSFDVQSGEKVLIKESYNAITADGFTLVAELADSEIANAMKDKLVDRAGIESPSIIMRNVGSIILDPEYTMAKPVLVSSPTSTCEAGGQQVDSEGNYNIAAYSYYENNANSSAMFLMSDGMMTASDAIVTDKYSNKDFLYSLFDVFFEQGDMPYGCRSIIFKGSILENLTIGTARIYAAVLMAIPVALAAVCGIVLVRRKNR